MKLKSLKIEDIDDNKLLVTRLDGVKYTEYLVLAKSCSNEFDIKYQSNILMNINNIIVVDKDTVDKEDKYIENLQSLLEKQLNNYK